MNEQGLIDESNRLLDQFESLLGTHRRRDDLLRTELRYTARLLFLRSRSGEPAGAAATAELGERLARLEADALEQQARLEASVAELRAGIAAAEGKLSAEPAGGAAMPAAHRAALDFVCLRNGIATHPDAIVPTDSETGVAGQSSLYFFDVRPRHGDPSHLIAKFDLPQRSAREWQSTRRLRQLDLPPNIILAEPYSHPDDGVTLFREARSNRAVRSARLSEYLLRHVRHRPAECAKSVRDALALIGALHRIEPGGHRYLTRHGAPTKWRDVLPQAWSDLRLEDVVPLARTCGGHWPGVDWAADETFDRHPEFRLPRPLPNPVARAVPMLRSDTGAVRVSRIHGDLNLTNVLVTSYPDGTPREVFVIDVANSEPHVATALDFARLEVDLWQQTFPALVGSPDEGREGRWPADMIRAWDSLDGRAGDPSDPPAPGEAGFREVVSSLRRAAFDVLAPSEADERSHYVLGDYYRSLFFSFLAQLRHKQVQSRPREVEAAVVGAALSLQVIDPSAGCSPAAAGVHLESLVASTRVRPRLG